MNLSRPAGTNLFSPYNGIIAKKESPPASFAEKRPEYTDEAENTHSSGKDQHLMPSPMPQYTDGYGATGKQGGDSEEKRKGS
ncbi:MAG: hypothetical protein HYU64_13510 [Armatimonadetes bacterium]|nr:hypothetical protein [Armatimonadota bacterium]